jgi:uncharacterized protein
MWSRYDGQAIYLDTNILIYAVEGQNEWSGLTKELFLRIDRKLLRTVTSELALAEVLVKPIARNDTVVIDKYRELLAPDSVIDVLPVGRSILSQAAQLRASLKLKLFDAIHVATARAAQCDLFMTHDERLGHAVTASLPWLSLSEVSKS